MKWTSVQIGEDMCDVDQGNCINYLNNWPLTLKGSHGLVILLGAFIYLVLLHLFSLVINKKLLLKDKMFN